MEKTAVAARLDRGTPLNGLMGPKGAGGLLLAVLLLVHSAFGSARFALAAPDDEEATVLEALSGSVIALSDVSGQPSPVHYLGVESPALGQRYHDEARLANAARVVGKRVLLRKSGADRLADGARARHVFILEGGATAENPGSPVAASLLAEGQVWRVSEGVDLDDWYRELEAGARLARAGLWEHYSPSSNPAYFAPLPPRGGAEVPRPAAAAPVAIAPAPFGTPWYGVRADRRLYPPLEAISGLGEPWRWVFSALRDNGVHAVFERVPHNVGGFFTPDLNAVGINARFAYSDPKAVAAALVHETSHARDYYAGEPMRTLEGCFQTEIRAYHTQAEAWLAFYGPGGKQPAVDDLDEGLNDLLLLFQRDRGRIEETVRRLYERQCMRIASR